MTEAAINEHRKAAGSHEERNRHERSDDDETPVQEPGILRKTQAEPPKANQSKALEEAATPGAQSEEDLIKMYYKLRKELEELKEKKGARIEKKSLASEEQLDQAANKRRAKNDRREAKKQIVTKRPGT